MSDALDAKSDWAAWAAGLAQRKPRRRNRHLEDDMQAALMRWAALTRMPTGHVSDYLIAIPNGGRRNPFEGARLKRQGVKAGVSDLFLAWPARTYSGLWLELKITGGVRTPAQKVWQDRMAHCGYAVRVAYSLDDAIMSITWYLGIGK